MTYSHHEDVHQVVLLAILYESHAWRQTVWHVVDDAVVVESKVRYCAAGFDACH